MTQNIEHSRMGGNGFIPPDLQVIPPDFDRYEEADHQSIWLYKGDEKYLLRKDGRLTPVPK